FTDLSVDEGPLGAYFGQNSVFLLMTLLLVCPALSMRLLAEERRSGTIEALMTAPVGSAGVVLGKYTAALATYVLMWLPTVLYVVILRKTGTVDWLVVLSSYLGLFLVGAQYLAIGALSSALSKSQFVALLITVLIQFGLFVLGIGEYIFDAGLLRDISAHVSMASQMEEFSRGLIDLRRIVFDLSLLFASLFVTVRIVDSWRWG
ncbi:MAG TPA: ABC transporter permease, partial [Polyangiaceae bacterium]|nr:ABC transporter permease [Polyangiaceae bacterium]